MKNLTIVFLLLLIASSVKGQNLNLEINAGYGLYNLSDIKSFQKSLLATTNIPGVKAVETFPGNLYYSFSVNQEINKKHIIGIEFSYFTTGGRNHLADYSGEYKVDMLLNGYQIGPKYQGFILLRDKLKMGYQFAGGITFSSVDMEERLIINKEEISSDKMKLKGTGWFFEPSLKVSYFVTAGLNLNFSGGYNFDVKGKLKMNGEETNLLANWSGLRFSVGIVYGLNLPMK